MKPGFEAALKIDGWIETLRRHDDSLIQVIVRLKSDWHQLRLFALLRSASSLLLNRGFFCVNLLPELFVLGIGIL